jgi:hypothetical protein
LGKQKKVTCRRATPGPPTLISRHTHPTYSLWSNIPNTVAQNLKQGTRHGTAIPTTDYLFRFAGRLLDVHHLQNLLLQEHAVQADTGEYVLEFDSGGEYVQGVTVDCVAGDRVQK